MDENKGINSGDVRRGFVGGVFAGLCCLIPLIAIAAGLGFIPGVMTIPRYRIYFIAAGLLIVILFTLRRLRKSKLESNQKFSIFVITIISFFAVLALFTYAVTPAVSTLVAGDSEYHTLAHSRNVTSAESKSAKTPMLHQVTLKVTGITCSSCKGTIENLINRVNGVKEANVDAGSGAGKVTYDANLTTKEAIAKAVEGQGTARTAYKATIVEDKKL